MSKIDFLNIFLELYFPIFCEFGQFTKMYSSSGFVDADVVDFHNRWCRERDQLCDGDRQISDVPVREREEFYQRATDDASRLLQTRGDLLESINHCLKRIRYLLKLPEIVEQE